MSVFLDPSLQKNLLKNLFSWYKKNGRHDMAWRKTSDPYAILVSEFMLQQTTVAAVTPYYDRFLKKFPTVKALSKSPLNDVLALWSGLGYYARARNLWAAAKMITDEYKGRVPGTQDELQKLPGVGLYTSGAVSSLAFNRPAIVLDGNIIRVLMRVLAMEEDARLKAVQVVLRKFILDLTEVSEKLDGPRHTVLALMDVGATVCLPQNPNCSACPFVKSCLAYAHGKQNAIPAKGDEIERPRIRRLYALVPYKGSYLVGRRPEEGLFGGLWEFPGVDSTPGFEPAVLLENLLQKETGLTLRVVRALPAFEHILSHREYSVRGFLFESPESKKLNKKTGRFYKQFKWSPLSDFKALGISAITAKLKNFLLTPRGGMR
jgi:A/G-specific adenine glycosylase